MTTATSTSADLPPGYYVDDVSGAWLSLPWPASLDLLPPSLGPGVIRWCESNLVHHLWGTPWRFTRGQRKFLILWYAVGPDGRWLYRSGVKRGAKGTGKDPFAAAMCLAELVGPVEFAGWDNGKPCGRPRRMPLVQVAANSEPQAKDLLRVANAMCPQRLRDEHGMDVGETRTALPSGGRFEVLTASQKTAEGDPATFIALNESHHMTESSGGHRIGEVARRNVGKSPAAIQARLCEYTNAHTMGADSVAERTYEAWQAQVSGKAKRQDILYDSTEAPPDTDLYDDDSRLRGLRAAYSDAEWADIARLSDEVLDPRTSVADSIRYYLNGLAAAEDAWVDPRKFDALAAPDTVVADGEQITLFLDCSKSGDATGLVACRLSDGYVWDVGVWQRPHGDRAKGWLAPRHEVDTAVRSTMERYKVTWFGVDPSPARDDEDEALYWDELLDAWHRDFRTKLLLWAWTGKGGNSVRFDMRLSVPGGAERNRLLTVEAEATAYAIDEAASLHHCGSAALRAHTHNAKRRANQWGTSLGKVTRDSTRLVDLAVCMVGARLGRRLVLDSGKLRPVGGKSRVIVLT